MKVAMIGWEYPPFKVGGLGTHCYWLTQHLANLGVKVDFYVPKRSRAINVKEKNLKVIEIGITKVYPYDRVEEGALEGDFFESVNTYNELCAEKIHGNYDLIHVHDWLTVKAGINLKHKLGKPLIVTIHSTEFDRSGWLNPNEYFINVEKEGMERADRVIAVSHYTKKVIVDNYGIPEDKIRVVHNAVNHVGEGKKKRKIVLFLGRLTIQKGAEFFLRAAKRVLEKEDCLFVVAGGGDMLPRLVDLSVELGIANRVMFTGPLTDEEVKHLYRIASVYVMPSVSEPFGITALEAASAGAATIVSKNSGVKEILKHCLTVDFWDTDEMANKIIALLRYDPLRRAITRNAKRDLNFITWERTAQKTLEVYREVV
ncbi:MAG: glycosyltransferase family 4 protein [Thermoplasmata archaeon]|nr:glycosyltransferase family 4 protein [Thermoplasmata archaeon]